MSRIAGSFARMGMAALVVVVSLAVCGRPPTPGPQIKLRFGFFPVPDYLPYFIIKGQGLDKKNGLQLEERPYSGGSAILEAMVAGAVDAAYVGSVPLLSAAERGLIPRAVVPVAAGAFADPDHPLLGVLAANSVNRWKDLEGQQIGVINRNSIDSAAIQGRLQWEGVRSYTLVEISPPNRGLAIAGGNVAAATMVEPFLTQSLIRGDGKLLGWIIGGPPFEHMETTLVVFSARFYRSRPQAVKGFLRAHLQAVRWIRLNPDETRSVLARRLKLLQEVVQKAYLPRWPLEARNDPALLEEMQRVLVKVGMLEAAIPASRLYDETLLKEVLAEKR